MDPIANLNEQREVAARIMEIDDKGDYSHDANPELEAGAVRLAELVLALDEWRRKGGFDPYLRDAPILQGPAASRACVRRLLQKAKMPQPPERGR